MLARIKDILIIVLLIALIVVLLYAGLIVKGLAAQTSSTLHNLSTTSQQLAQLVEESRTYIAAARPDAATSRLALERNLQLGEAAIGTIRLLNTQTIPRLHATLDTTNTLIANTDSTVNVKLAAQAAQVIGTLNSTVEAVGNDAHLTFTTLNVSIADITRTTSLSLSELNSLLASPDLKATFANLSTTSAQLSLSAQNLQATTAHAPEIAATFEKMAHTTSRWQKVMLLSRIASYFRPF